MSKSGAVLATAMLVVSACGKNPCAPTPPPASWASVQDDVAMPGANICARSTDRKLVLEVYERYDAALTDYRAFAERRGWERARPLVTSTLGVFAMRRPGSEYLITTSSVPGTNERISQIIVEQRPPTAPRP